jgi:hypothetical protein
MVVNKNQQRIRKLTTKQRQVVAKEYYGLFHRSLYTTVAEAIGKDRTHVYYTWKGKYAHPDPAIEAALWAEVSRLICTEEQRGSCQECPLRKACEQMADKPNVARREKEQA